MTAADPILRIEGLRKYFAVNDSLLDRLLPGIERGFIRAVDDVDLAVERGETLGLVGESGCGKSTLARTALRLLEPTDGQVFFDDENVTAFGESELRSFRSDVQMIFQDPFASLNPRYRVSRTLREPMRVHGIGDSRQDRQARAERLLERVGLSADQADRYPHEFSGGQRQRVALARALAVEPSVIVADEPLSALDVSVQARILKLLDELRAEMGLTMVFISHDLSIIRRISDRFAVMYLGKIVESGPTNDLFEDPNHPYTRALLSSIPVPDPSHDRDRIILQGDVPKPDDPPNGCRFHPRCPRVIPPDSWPDDQAAFRQYVQLRNRIENGELEPEVTREKLAARRAGDVPDEAVRQELYEEHVVGAEAFFEEGVSPSRPVRDVIFEALALVQRGEETAAVAALDDAHGTVCESVAPELEAVGTGERAVSCHLHGADAVEPSSPVEPATGGDG